MASIKRCFLDFLGLFTQNVMGTRSGQKVVLLFSLSFITSNASVQAMSEKYQLLSTRILDYHGKIGPFFFKEFLFVFMGCASLFFLVLLIFLFMLIQGILLPFLPGTFLLIVSLTRFVFIKEVTSTLLAELLAYAREVTSGKHLRHN